MGANNNLVNRGGLDNQPTLTSFSGAYNQWSSSGNVAYNKVESKSPATTQQVMFSAASHDSKLTTLKAHYAP